MTDVSTPDSPTQTLGPEELAGLSDEVGEGRSLLILCAIYFMLTAPLRATRHGAHLAWGPYYHMWAALSSVFWLGFTVLFLWLAYQHVPQVHALLDQLPSFWHKRQTSFAV